LTVTFANAELDRDLLVESTGDYQLADITFARSQTPEAPAQDIELGVLAPGIAGVLECPLHGIDQLVVAKWFRQQRDGSVLHAALTVMRTSG
jgi:hypothetical protein